ncbi:carbohydrate ABC transporter permease [Paenibacillus terrigena]|uniref:carbohydrate ABC transporter permease n=1 Tax=Paenibacillus terrigena TaxID=369333 RepID=UPI0003748804|nr:carbohydrate ABC transporter permease [Paenibacillus terrigena]
MRNLRLSSALPILRTLFLASLALILVTPILLTVINSFMTEHEITANYASLGQTSMNTWVTLKLIPDWVSFDQYFTLLLKTPEFLRMFWNSVGLVVPIIVGQLICASLAAFAFAKLNFPGRDSLFFIYLITLMLPFQVTLVPNYMMVDRLGLLNHMGSIILPGIFAPFGVFLLRQFMLNIPSGYMEAAKMDGASTLRIFLKIILPMVRPGIAALVVLLFADYWNMVEQPLIFLQDAALQPLSLFLTTIQKGAFGVSFAASTLYMIPMVLLFLYAEPHFVEGIEMSGIKG